MGVKELDSLKKETEKFIIMLRKHPELREKVWELLSDNNPGGSPPRFHLAEELQCSLVGMGENSAEGA